MDLKNSVRVAILISFTAFFSCNEPEISEEVLNTIWDSIPAATGLKVPGENPKVVFLKEYSKKQTAEDCAKYSEQQKKEQCEKDAKEMANTVILGYAYKEEEKIEIYLKTISESFESYQLSENRWVRDGKIAYICGITAHEMLHIALWRLGYDGGTHHKIMMDEKLLEKMIDLMGKKFNFRDLQAAKELLITRSLASGIKMDEIRKRQQERQKAVK